MALETESLCGGAPSERTPERQNLRNGYRDRGYGRVRNFAHTQARGAAFITRIGWRSVRLFHPSGEAFDLSAALSDTGPEVAEHPLTIGSGRGRCRRGWCSRASRPRRRNVRGRLDRRGAERSGGATEFLPASRDRQAAHGTPLPARYRGRRGLDWEYTEKVLSSRDIDGWMRQGW